MMEQSDRQLTEKSPTPKRCVNLDWLEVHVREPIGQPHTADYFRNHGCTVTEREYGTRVYKEMFVIDGSDGLPAIEVRRNPASQGLHGIHDPEESHIRIVNRICYFDDAAEKLQNFLIFHGYTDIRISRVDICLDFVLFDFGDDPFKFIRRYMKRKYSKINAGRIDLHGEDTWESLDINSVKWGRANSTVSTKLYNKTMELKDKKSGLFGKPYIRQAWFICGFIDDIQHCTKEGKEVNVWRVEFSIQSAKANWAPIELDGKVNKRYSLRNTLDMYKGRENLLTAFASLAKHYFHFKKYKHGVRKDRCPDKKLFNFEEVQQVYKLTKDLEVCGDGNRDLQKYNRLLQLLQEYDMSRFDIDQKEAAQTLINALKEDNINSDLARPWNAQDRAIIRALILRKCVENNWSELVVKDELKRAFKIADSILHKF